MSEQHTHEHVTVREIDGTHRTYRFPAKLGQRGMERIYRRRELVQLDLVLLGVPVGPALAIWRGRQFASANWGRMPTIISMTEDQYRELCKDPALGPVAELAPDGKPEEIFGMFIERRDNGDLEGVCWVEIVDIRRAD